jgi:hypothetical protein
MSTLQAEVLEVFFNQWCKANTPIHIADELERFFSELKLARPSRKATSDPTRAAMFLAPFQVVTSMIAELFNSQA